MRCNNKGKQSDIYYISWCIRLTAVWWNREVWFTGFVDYKYDNMRQNWFGVLISKSSFTIALQAIVASITTVLLALCQKRYRRKAPGHGEGMCRVQPIRLIASASIFFLSYPCPSHPYLSLRTHIDPTPPPTVHKHRHTHKSARTDTFARIRLNLDSSIQIHIHTQTGNVRDPDIQSHIR